MKKWIRGLLAFMVWGLLMVNVSFGAEESDGRGQHLFKVISQEDGLLDLSVSDMVKDKYGFIWIATQGGLFRYDGSETTVYRNDPFETKGLIHNLIQCMYYDRDNNELWLGTYQGISRFYIDKGIFENYTVKDNGISNNIIVSITKDQQGNMWFGTMDGLNRLDVESQQMVVYPVAEGVVRKLFINQEGQMLVGTHHGLLRYNPSEDQLEAIAIDLPSPYVMDILQNDQGDYTLGLWDGGVVTLTNDYQIKDHISLSDNRVYKFIGASDGTLWIGTWGGGLYQAREDEIVRYPGTGKIGDIGHTVIYSFYEDEEGILWIGTNGGGIFVVDPNEINQMILTNDPDDDQSLDAGKINSIFEDERGDIWIAVYNKGLNRYNPQTQVLTKYNQENEDSRKLVNNQVMDMVEWQGKMLVATGVDVEYYDDEADTFVRMNIFDNTIVYSLAVDRDQQLWVGTYLDGVYILDQSLKVIEHLSADRPNSISDNLIYDIYPTDFNEVWIGTNNGLDFYDTKTHQVTTYIKEEGNRQALASNTVRAIVEDDNHHLWIAMVGGGVSRFNRETGQFKSFTEQDGLIDNTAIDVLYDKNGKIWVSTHNGLCVIDAYNESITNLSQLDNIGGTMFTGSGIMDHEGNLYFGGTHGVNRIAQDTIVHSGKMPPLYITAFKILNEPAEAGTLIFNNRTFTLDASEDIVEFGFKALDFENLAQVNYSYKLEGVDKEWIMSGNRNFVSYSHLSPGTYTFNVRMKGIQNLYSEPVTMTFTINKPWYKTYFAYVIYGVIILIFLYGLMKVREGFIMKARNRELNKVNDQLESAVKELEEVSIRDSLTGLYNRRYFDMMGQDHLQLAKRGRDYLSLLIVDVDDFKDINDQYGHVTGDFFLKSFSEKLQALMTRSSDFCARYGGDEFVIILYDTDAEGAAIVSEKIKESLTSLEVQNGDELLHLQVTASIGTYSVIPDKDLTLESIVKKADHALYEAKKEGKNRIRRSN